MGWASFPSTPVERQIYGRRPPSDRIDIDCIRKWSEDCLAVHHSTCKPPYSTKPWSAITLIDVELNCLATLNDPVQYFALSYVWGPSTDAQALRKNVALLKHPGGLLTCVRLPDTIRDAMHLAKVFGVRFLWVDRLCIVQDDEDHKKQQISQMARIYECAYITIIAADGEDANHGLRGIGGPSRGRRCRPEILSFSPAVALRICDWEDLETVCPNRWHTRAWTFQERSVSKRKIVFVNGTAFWECGRHITSEFSSRSRSIVNGVWPDFTVGEPNYPRLEEYYNLVTGFNHRELSYPGDAQFAFAAVLQKMAKAFTEGFHFGIPETFFDIGLLWTSSTKKSLKRRPMFPSWSWLGWAGPVEMDSTFSTFDWNNGRGSPVLQVRPITTWKKVGQDGKHVIISNSYSSYLKFAEKQVGETSDVNLLEGRIKDQSGLMAEPSSHANLPGLQFGLPFPAVSTPPPVPYDAWTTKLHFSTRCCAFKVTIPDVLDLSLEASLVDELGDWAGIIRYDRLFNGKECNLLEMSHAVGLSAHFSTTEQNRLQGLSSYHFYNVLQVEWVDSIAYRCGVGRVLVEAWERQKPATIPVTLG